MPGSTSGIPSLLSSNIEPRLNTNLPSRLVDATTQELTVGNDVSTICSSELFSYLVLTSSGEKPVAWPSA